MTVCVGREVRMSDFRGALSPTMIPDKLLCGIVGHASSYAIIVPSEECNGSYADAETLVDLIACLDEVHRSCPCRRMLGNSAWRANLPFGQTVSAALATYEPQEDQLLDGRRRVEDLFSEEDLPPRTIHLMAATDPPLDMPPAQLGQRVVKFYGAVCRVIGSREIRLPDTTDFLTIATTPGCFFIDKSEWYLNRYRGSQRCKIPIIRRGPGFGKTTFLSTVAAYFDDCFNANLLPVCRDEAIRFIHTVNLTPLIVLSLDFKELKFEESMTDADMREECRGFMMAAATAFCQHYARFFETLPPMTAPKGVKHPYEIVSKFAKACGCHIFLAIDNYTSPFLNVNPELFARIEKAIYSQILAHILVDVHLGHVFRGCITGLPIGGDAGQVPFADSPVFERFTEDLSDIPEHNAAIGITGQDVRDLLRSFVYLHAHNLDEALLERIVARWAKDRVYPMRGVIAALGDVQVAGGRLIVPDVYPGADEDDSSEAPHLPASDSTPSDSSVESNNLLRTPFTAPKW